MIKYQAFAITFVSLLFVSCQVAPTRLAFIGPLSGTNSSLGVEGRNGFLQSYNSVDSNKGFTVDWYDDKADSQICLEQTEKAIGLGTKIIVFHTTSAAARLAIEFALSKNVLALSSTVSDTYFDKRKDGFFRTALSNHVYGEFLARFAAQSLNKDSSTLILGDDSNKIYVDAIIDSYAKELLKEVEISSEIVRFDSTVDTFDPYTFLAKLDKQTYEQVLIIANPINSALVVQNLKKLGKDARILLSPWGVNQEFIMNSGSAGEGVVGVSLVPLEGKTDLYSVFAEEYLATYGKEPSYYAQYGFEICRLVLDLLPKGQMYNREQVMQKLYSEYQIAGLNRELLIDEYGDGSANPIFYKVLDAEFTEFSCCP